MQDHPGLSSRCATELSMTEDEIDSVRVQNNIYTGIECHTIDLSQSVVDHAAKVCLLF